MRAVRSSLDTEKCHAQTVKRLPAGNTRKKHPVTVKRFGRPELQRQWRSACKRQPCTKLRDRQMREVLVATERYVRRDKSMLNRVHSPPDRFQHKRLITRHE